jgi:hypothetical protein
MARSGNFLQRLVKLLNRRHRLAQATAQLVGAQTQSIQHLLLARGLLLHLRQRVAGGGVDRLQRNHIFAPQRRDGPGEHGLNLRALANFPANVAGQTCLWRFAHQLQRLLHLGIGNDVEIGRLAQAHRQRLLESIVEDRITGGVGEVGKEDGILFGECSSFVGAVEKTASDQQGNHYQSNRNQYPPAAARRLLCRPSWHGGNSAVLARRLARGLATLGRHHRGGRFLLFYDVRGAGSARLGLSFQPLQIGSNVRRVLVAQLSVFLQCFIDDAFEIAWKIRIQPHRSNRGFVQNRIKQNGSRITAKREHASRHLVEHCAKGKQVSTRIKLLSFGLLGRHVGNRS